MSLIYVFLGTLAVLLLVVFLIVPLLRQRAVENREIDQEDAGRLLGSFVYTLTGNFSVVKDSFRTEILEDNTCLYEDTVTNHRGILIKREWRSEGKNVILRFNEQGDEFTIQYNHSRPESMFWFQQNMDTPDFMSSCLQYAQDIYKAVDKAGWKTSA